MGKDIFQTPYDGTETIVEEVIEEEVVEEEPIVEQEPISKPIVMNNSLPEAQQWLEAGTLINSMDGIVYGLEPEEAEAAQYKIADLWFEWELTSLSKRYPDKSEWELNELARNDSPIYLFFAYCKNRLMTRNSNRRIHVSLGPKEAWRAVLPLEFMPCNDSWHTQIMEKPVLYGELYLLRQERFFADFAHSASVKTPKKAVHGKNFNGRTMAEAWMEGGYEEHRVLKHLVYRHVKSYLLNIENRQGSEFAHADNSGIGTYWPEPPHVRGLAEIQAKERELEDLKERQVAKMEGML